MQILCWNWISRLCPLFKHRNPGSYRTNISSRWRSAPITAESGKMFKLLRSGKGNVPYMPLHGNGDGKRT
ncbi:hypothetical protein Pyn_38521 [Prunus yedoensis var. nudiflora]|uniref:Uncharacterized protein n=1 Tax=Prunus yedoensis var. nudiflora TaxID=2094558 RepID=A0A314UN92_PRUYE|nr:hypothetical protein Pyn_38521 [Prunus yedoensis var. nudiflora]